VSITTKTGDDGTTSLLGGDRVRKDDARIEAGGAVDETNVIIGAARAAAPPPEIEAILAAIQRMLFTLGAELAAPARDAARIGDGDVVWIEREIESVEAKLPRVDRFVLPGGTPAAALLHQARAVCRRAERRVVAVSGLRREPLVSLNRLGDLLFLLARRTNQLAGLSEEEWSRRPGH
jgi:cob(I)alamin adenosyltransferase